MDFLSTAVKKLVQETPRYGDWRTDVMSTLRRQFPESSIRERWELVRAAEKDFPVDNVIVTNQPAIVEYLAEMGIVGEVFDKPTTEDIIGKHVYGVLPHAMSCLTNLYTEIYMEIPFDPFDIVLTLEQVKQYVKGMRTYHVVEE